MVYRRVDCPHCGNEIVVNNLMETKKCCWCKRIFSVKFKGNGKKAKCEVEAIDFPGPKNYKDWRDKDIYGRKHN